MDKKYLSIGTVPLLGQLPLPSAPQRPVYDDPAVLPVSPGLPADSYVSIAHVRTTRDIVYYLKGYCREDLVLLW